MKAASVEKFLLHNNVEEESYLWVCVKTLQESDVFGLEDLDLGDPRDETESNMALVSDGAEVILISKKFFMENAGPNLLADLRASSYIMPDLKTLTLDLQKREFWAKYQEKVVDASFREMHVTRKVKKHR
ncbi:unnamed protein product [Lymnaea stagnalis]|uniref:Uncharacterized protein n=1 Tax=Lymnaea stagnalis TaxID=6523 RepID=A0AAV2HSH8_LYMST